MISKIPEKLYLNDVVYHYTSVNTAIEFILEENRLKLSSRKYSLDPIENKATEFSYSWYEDLENTVASDQDASKVIQFIKEELKHTKQVCFCMNNDNFDKNELDYFGFLKPRMWDQYGQNYNGVCLAFDTRKFEDTGFHKNKIKYKDYNYLKCIKNQNIEIYNLIQEGLDNYINLFKLKIIDSLFYKHKDYIGENEYRVISFAQKECDYLYIKDSLLAIIISINALKSDFNYRIFKEYSDKYNVPLLFIDWKHDGITIKTISNMESNLRLANKLINRS